jgi:hypothetical protein
MHNPQDKELTVILCILAGIAILVFPPWQQCLNGNCTHIGYGLLFRPPRFSNSIAYGQLIVQLIVWGVAAGVIYWWISRKNTE